MAPVDLSKILSLFTDNLCFIKLVTFPPSASLFPRHASSLYLDHALNKISLQIQFLLYSSPPKHPRLGPTQLQVRKLPGHDFRLLLRWLFAISQPLLQVSTDVVSRFALCVSVK